MFVFPKTSVKHSRQDDRFNNVKYLSREHPGFMTVRFGLMDEVEYENAQSRSGPQDSLCLRLRFSEEFNLEKRNGTTNFFDYFCSRKKFFYFSQKKSFWIKKRRFFSHSNESELSKPVSSTCYRNKSSEWSSSNRNIEEFSSVDQGFEPKRFLMLSLAAENEQKLHLSDLYFYNDSKKKSEKSSHKRLFNGYFFCSTALTSTGWVRSTY